MDDDSPVWIELAPGRDEPLVGQDAAGAEATVFLPPGKGWHALFACQLRLRPSEALTKLKWGFNWSALLDEAIERQRLFIESQHFPGERQEEPPERRTLALRAVFDPQAGGIRLALLGKLWAPFRQTARRAALEQCRELLALVPHDYELAPAASRTDFLCLAGWDLLDNAAEPQALAEVERFENIVSTGDQRFYLLGAWKDSKFANEQFWRALAGAGQPAMLSILLRPVVLQPYEAVTLKEISDFIKNLPAGAPTAGKTTLSSASQTAYFQHYSAFAGQYFGTLAESLRRPYLLQVHLAAPEGLPEFLPRAIGYAATHPQEKDRPAPGFQVTHPSDPAAVDCWRVALYWLEPEAVPWQGLDVRFTRLRKLADAHEAHALFRFPYPPEPGIPGLVFLDS